MWELDADFQQAYTFRRSLKKERIDTLLTNHNPFNEFFIHTHPLLYADGLRINVRSSLHTNARATLVDTGDLRLRMRFGAYHTVAVLLGAAAEYACKENKRLIVHGGFAENPIRLLPEAFPEFTSQTVGTYLFDKTIK